MKRFTEMFQRMLIAEPITMKILLHDDVDSGLASRFHANSAEDCVADKEWCLDLG